MGFNYKHIYCNCGGTIGQFKKVNGFECEKCGKRYELNELSFDKLLSNYCTGWIFPMTIK